MDEAFFNPHRPIVRWTVARKQLLLEAYRRGEIGDRDLRLIHDLGPEELAEWQRRNGSGGESGRARLRNRGRRVRPDPTSTSTGNTDVSLPVDRTAEPCSRSLASRGRVEEKKLPVEAEPVKAIEPVKLTVERRSEPEPVKAIAPVKLSKGLCRVTVERRGEPDLVFDFSGADHKRRMRHWFDMYIVNAAHNPSIYAVVMVADGQRIEDWRPRH